MKSLVNILAVYILYMLFNSCSSEPSDKSRESSKTKHDEVNLNISLLLDLSDRIDSIKYPNPAMQFYKRDLGYISSIADAFETHVKGKKIRAMDDQMQVFFEPVPSNPQINSLAQSLKIRLTRENVSKQQLEEIKARYNELSRKIYEMAITTQQYSGSDIWNFFNNKVKDYCIKPGSQNVLVVITDGYIFHKDSHILQGNKSSYITPELIRQLNLDKEDYASKFQNKGYGIISRRSDLNDLRVLILGVNPSKNNKYDGELLKLFWGKWLSDMGVKNFSIKSADIPSNMDEVIKDYILEKEV